jgi:hypothetical protein
MPSLDPTRTVHFAIALAIAKRTGSDVPLSESQGPSILAWSVSPEASTPELRANYAMTVYGAWVLLALACVAAMVALAFLAQLLIGKNAVEIAVSLTAGCACFCLAGATNALWRRYYAGQARRRLRDDTGDGYQLSMQRALPRNSSLVFQAVVGAIAAIVVSTNWGQ